MAVHEHLLRTSDDFVWQVDAMSHGRFTIDVEFLDLRIATNNASIHSSFVLFFKSNSDKRDSCDIQ